MDGQIRDILAADPSAVCRNAEDQSRTFEQAAEIALYRANEDAGEGTSGGIEAANVTNRADLSGNLIDGSLIDALPVVSNHTSEHEVLRQASAERVIKRTWAGFFGQVPVANDGKLGRRNASPAEYLRRMALHLRVFGGDLEFEGVSISGRQSLIIGAPPGEPSFVISQPWFEKTGVVTNESIRALLDREGFIEVPGSYFGWYRPADGIVIIDAKPDNFILTEEGLIPIDLQMAQFSGEELTAAGLGRSLPDEI